jgi:thiamine biosynthesis lipoprotein ApbE
VLALNPPPDENDGEGGRGWSIDVRHSLFSDAPPIVKLKLQNQSFSCSAVREADQRQSDVVNPLTGQPLDGNAACVVLTASATDAEVFSTALLAMGSE